MFVYIFICPPFNPTNNLTKKHQVVEGDGQGVPVGRISRDDVASLCVAALESAKASHATLSCVSTSAQKPGRKVSSSSQAPEKNKKTPAAGPGSGDALFPYKLILRREGRPDETPLKRKPHRLAVSLFLVALSAAAVGLGAVVAQVVAFVSARLRCVLVFVLVDFWTVCVWTDVKCTPYHRPPPANAACALWRQQPPKLSALQK